jgi:hypothetical protein
MACSGALAARGALDRLLQHLSRGAQGLMVAQRLVSADFGGLDVPRENAQRGQGLVGRFLGQALASYQRR